MAERKVGNEYMAYQQKINRAMPLLRKDRENFNLGNKGVDE